MTAHWRTTILAILAGATFLGSAAAQEGPWTTSRVLAVVAGVLVAALGVFARDAAGPPKPPETERPTVPPVSRGLSAADFDFKEPGEEPSAALGPRPEQGTGGE